MSDKKGRPFSDSEKKTASLHAKCTQTERIKIQKDANELDFAISEYVMDAIEKREKLQELSNKYASGNIDVFLAQADKLFSKTFGE